MRKKLQQTEAGSHSLPMAWNSYLNRPVDNKSRVIRRGLASLDHLSSLAFSLATSDSSAVMQLPKSPCVMAASLKPVRDSSLTAFSLSVRSDRNYLSSLFSRSQDWSPALETVWSFLSCSSSLALRRPMASSSEPILPSAEIPELDEPSEAILRQSSLGSGKSASRKSWMWLGAWGTWSHRVLSWSWILQSRG